MSQINVKAPQQFHLKQKARKEPSFASLVGATPDEVDAWLDDNVKSVSDVKDVLKMLVKMELSRL